MDKKYTDCIIIREDDDEYLLATPNNFPVGAQIHITRLEIGFQFKFEYFNMNDPLWDEVNQEFRSQAVTDK